jgi:hypothetical protein
MPGIDLKNGCFSRVIIHSFFFFAFFFYPGGVLNPRDIVDGHREKTLAFLWKLIFHFQVCPLEGKSKIRKTFYVCADQSQKR